VEKKGPQEINNHVAVSPCLHSWVP